MNSESPRNFRYRFDLDGLRGIAIALVVLYHVFVGRVSGGVDVFLLLSGYFFLGSQLRYADKPGASLNPWWPIWRTLRRLVPSLALVIAVSYGLVRAFTPELMRTELARQITATMLYYQNWELAAQNADYAAASSSTSPLQHMWSMAVQGQFYLMGIFFALGLAGILRLRYRGPRLAGAPRLTVTQVAGPILVVATVVSFVYASRDGLYGTSLNYYSTWSRAWELTLGAVLAIYGAKLHVPERLSNPTVGVGLLCLALTGTLIADSSAFPGPLSLLPLGGAVLIIVGGGGSISRVMASKQARWLGDVAYPLYLWHWPLLILSTTALDLTTPPWWLGLAIIAISLALADLTHRFIEKPLRQAHKRPLASDLPVHRALTRMRQPAGAARAAGGVVVGLAVVGLLSISPRWSSTLDSADAEPLNPNQYPGATAFALGASVPEGVVYKPDPILARGIVPPTTKDYCFINQEWAPDYFPETKVDGVNPCLYGDLSSATEIYLVGGSHAEQWMAALDRLGREMHFKIVPLLRQGCPVELGEDLTISPSCAEFSEHVAERIAANKPALVISNTTRPQGADGRGPDTVPAGYAAFWEFLSDNGISFLGLRDNPWDVTEDGEGQQFDECYVATEDAVGCGMTADHVYAPVDPSAAILAQYRNMIGIDTAPWFCNTDGECPVVIGNTMVYRDMHHITNAFAESAIPMLREALRPFLNGEEQQQQAPADAAPASSTPASADEQKTSAARPAPTTQATTPQLPAPYPDVAAGDAV